MLTPEQQAREIINQKLEQAGRVIQNPGGMNLAASRGVAVREVHVGKWIDIYFRAMIQHLKI